MPELPAISGPERQEPSRIQPVVDKLNNIPHSKVGLLLDKKLNSIRAVDPIAGIAIVNLEDEGTITSDAGYEYHFHGARVMTSNPETPNFVNPHYHLKGEEPYHILGGDNGEMNLGRVINGAVVWNEPYTVKAGDKVEVQEGEVHSLRNNGDTPLDFTFACPKNHLQDHSEQNPDGDRYLTKDLPNGIPPQYPIKSFL